MPQGRSIRIQYRFAATVIYSFSDLRTHEKIPDFFAAVGFGAACGLDSGTTYWAGVTSPALEGARGKRGSSASFTLPAVG
jgi:hypothetical protein